MTIAVNHLKSNGSDCNDIADPDLGEGRATATSRVRGRRPHSSSGWPAVRPLSSPPDEPPNHKYVTVQANVAATDQATPSVTLVSRARR